MKKCKFLIVLTGSEDTYITLVTPSEGADIADDNDRALALYANALPSKCFETFKDLVNYCCNNDIEIVDEYIGAIY